MTREEAKKLLPIIKAYAEGKAIESRCIKGDTSLWYDDKDPSFDDDFEYRIKPEKVERIDKKYISGDFVYIHGSLRIINNCDGYYATYYDEEETIQEVNVDVIEGVPLTQEILKENGWVKEEKDGSVFSLSEAFMGGDENDEDNYTCFQLYYQNKKDGWVIDMRGEPLKFEIHYIHELQHLFFGFGINHEMEI